MKQYFDSLRREQNLTEPRALCSSTSFSDEESEIGGQMVFKIDHVGFCEVTIWIPISGKLKTKNIPTQNENLH